MTRINPGVVGRRALHLMSALLVVSTASATRAKEPTPPDLSAATRAIDHLLAERRKTSSTYKIHGKLRAWDLGSRTTSFSRPHRFLIDDFAGHLGTIVFHAVCREHRKALKTLARIDGQILGGLFDAEERLYLTDLARRLEAKPAPAPHRASPPNDLRSINRRRRLVAALDSGQSNAARRLLARFASLCRKW